MEGLPFLPGNTFRDPTKSKFHRSHTLGYSNGYSVQKTPMAGIGGEPHPTTQLAEKEPEQQQMKPVTAIPPTLMYGDIKVFQPSTAVPAYIAFDKKVLKFNAYFSQTVDESALESVRTRPVYIYYYLEDDSISVVEPQVPNSGIPQGKLMKRQRLPRGDGGGDHWHWKHLNLGISVQFYGIVFRIVDCDTWTKEFMESEGIELNSAEEMPPDPYSEQRGEQTASLTFKAASTFDKTRQFLEMDRKVLRFYCMWDDRDSMFGEMRPYSLQYYLVDDTVEVREKHSPNDGREPFPLLLRRQKLPKDRNKIGSTFPSIYMELSDAELSDWYTPVDFGIGKTIFIFGRRFLIYDCDSFTRSFYRDNFGVTDFTPIDIGAETREQPKHEIPPYNGFGSLEDSLQSCLSLVPHPPKKDFIKMLENDHKVLRYAARLDSVREEDKNRRFVISYRLADDMMTIYEPPVRNSGIIGGKFLERTRVCKPGCALDSPVFYGPRDFYIGAVAEVFNHRFRITDADDYVLKYMEENAPEFPESHISMLKDKLQSRKQKAGGDVATPGNATVATTTTTKRLSVDTESLLQEVRTQLRKRCYTGKDALYKNFLDADKDRSGHVDKEEVRGMCRRANLPVDEELLDLLIAGWPTNLDGKINFTEFRKFFTEDEDE